MAVLVYGRRVNHILHFLLGFVTFFLWWLVWLYLAITGGEKRRVVTVDDYGNILEQEQGVSGGGTTASSNGGLGGIIGNWWRWSTGGEGSKWRPVIGIVGPVLLLVVIVALASSGGGEEPTSQASQASIPATATQVVSTSTPTLTPTPTTTPTPGPSPTPRPTVTPWPTATSTPTLAETARAALWVNLSQDRNGYLTVRADPAFDIGAFELDVFVDGSEYCNTSQIYADEGGYELGCEYEPRTHSAVTRVSVQTPLGDLRCARNFQSTGARTVFACEWR